MAGVRITRLAWIYLVFTMIITWDRVCGRPPLSPGHMDDEGVTSEDHVDAVEELRRRILQDLGFHRIPSNLSTISTQEYLRAYREYMGNVQKRRQAQRPMWKNARQRRNLAYFKLHSFFPEQAQTQETGEHSWMWAFPLSPLREEQVEIRQGVLWLDEGCRLNNETAEEVEEDREEEEKKEVKVDVTNLVRRWRRRQRRGETNFTISIYCPQKREEEGRMKEGQSEMRLDVLGVSRGGGGGGGGGEDGGRVRRELRREGRGKLRVSDFEDGGDERVKERRLGKKKARDCSDQMGGRSCCRKSLKVSFEELKVTEFILAPASFDMHYCEGRCSARRLPYASNHAIFQHIVLKGGRGTKLCCSPTKLSEIDVIQRDPTKEDQLKVTVIHNAKVEECGCS